MLFALPFLQFGFGEGHGGACAMDHEPRHGGRLWMLGETHLELVERGDRIELYLSDLSRRPLRARTATAAFDDHAPQAVGWDLYRLVTTRPEAATTVLLRIELAGAPPLSIRLPLPDRKAGA